MTWHSSHLPLLPHHNNKDWNLYTTLVSQIALCPSPKVCVTNTETHTVTQGLAGQCGWYERTVLTNLWRQAVLSKSYPGHNVINRASMYNNRGISVSCVCLFPGWLSPLWLPEPPSPPRLPKGRMTSSVSPVTMIKVKTHAHTAVTILGLGVHKQLPEDKQA
jgi:hypothetical protein